MDASSEDLLHTDEEVKRPLNFLQGQREILDLPVYSCGRQVGIGRDFLHIFHYYRQFLIERPECEIYAFRRPPKLQKKRNRKTG